MKLLEKNKTMGCLHDLYNSIENLSKTYLQPDLSKTTMLNPKFSACAAGIPFLQPENNEPAESLNIYMRPKHYYERNQAEVPNLKCPSCRGTIYHRCQLAFGSPVADNTIYGGFVKEMVTFMVTDNLEVKPLSTKSSLTLLNRLNVTDVGALEERDVSFGIEEVCQSSVAYFN